MSCNQLVEEIFGYRPNELTGNNINMLMPSPHKEKHNSYLANYSKGGDPKVIGHVRNVPAKHKNGTGIVLLRMVVMVTNYFSFSSFSSSRTY